MTAKTIAGKVRTASSALVLSLGLGIGCAPPVPNGYGLSHGPSLNGTSALADWLNRNGHQVRTAVRLSEELGGWAEVIVRFAGRPGPPGQEEADWYLDWLTQHPARSLVYVVRDYDATAEYWRIVAQQLRETGDLDGQQRALEEARRASSWPDRLPPAANPPADSQTWFATGRPPSLGPTICSRLGGPWAEGFDPNQAALPLHTPLAASVEQVLLTGDGHPLAMDWEVQPQGRVLVLANGSFLVNFGLVNPARRQLAAKVVDWIGSAPQRVAFVDGPTPVGPPEPPPSLVTLLIRTDSLRWVALHFGIAGLLACLARFPRLGRPVPEPVPPVGRIATHAEAVGDLLQQTPGGAAFAQAKLAAYHAWRHATSPARPHHHHRQIAKDR